MMCYFIGAFAAYMELNGQPTPVGVCVYECTEKKIIYRYVPYGMACPSKQKLTMAFESKASDPLMGSSTTQTKSENEDDATKLHLVFSGKQ